MKRGPKTDPSLGPLTPKTVLLDELTVRQLVVIGKNLSDGIRKASRVAYAKYQATPDNDEGKPS